MTAEPKKNNDDPQDAELEGQSSAPEIPQIVLPDDVADSEQELAAQREQVLRLRAEMENLRARTARELRDERKYAAMPVVRDLLPVLDNIDRALEAAEGGGDGGLLEGFRLVRQQLLSVLDSHHCNPIDAVGQPFDPHLHEAILQQPSEEYPAGVVTMVTQIGYVLHDRVVRPSQVIVSSGPAASGDEAR